MSLGTDIKAFIDGIDDALGVDFTLTQGDASEVALGKCGYHELSPASVRDAIGEDYADEISVEWALIEVPAETRPKNGEVLTNELTGEGWNIRRVSTAQAAGVVIRYRCYCSKQMV